MVIFIFHVLNTQNEQENGIHKVKNK